MRSSQWIAPAILFAAALGGCARGTSPAAGGIFSPLRPSTNALRAADAYPSESAHGTFAVLGEEGAAIGTVEIEIVAGPSADQWRVLHRHADEEAPFREDLLTRTEDGVVMLETHSRDRDALTVYDPPLLIMPTTLGTDATEQEVRLTVHPVDDRSRVRRRGTAVNRIRLEGTQDVRVGDRWIRCRRARSEFRAQLAPAVVENVTERWHAAESPVGVVGERYDEKLFILGALSSTRGHLWILTDE